MPTSSSTSARPPGWARLVDSLCLALLTLAIVVAVWGGFRMQVGGVRIALTSPGRLLLWAAALALVRHVLAPGAPIHRDLPQRLISAWRAPDVRAAVSVAMATRGVILLVGYLSVFLFGYFNQSPPMRVADNELTNLQARWDTGWYLGIALGGYANTTGRKEDDFRIVFFPALPMTMRVAGRLLGGSNGALLLGGTLVVLSAFVGALVYLYRLARDLLGDDEKARHALWLVATYPFALFYSAVYTESLFLVGAAGAFYHFRRREFAWAGVWGLLVGLTRPNGCLLSIALALLAVTPWLPVWLAGARRSPEHEGQAPGRSALAGALLTAAMPGVGMLLYSAFAWWLTSEPLSWVAGQREWNRSYQGLAILVTERFNYIATKGFYAYTAELPDDLLQGAAVVFVLIAVWGVIRRFGLAYGVFILVNILPPLAAGGLLSAGRLTSVLFPAFMWLAAVTPARQRPAWLAVFMAIQALNASLFYTWRGIY